MKMNPTHELRILGAAGDTRLTWDANDPADRERARAEVARLRTAGYLFFLVDGTPADEVTAGNGELVARFATDADLLDPTPTEAQDTAPAPTTDEPEPAAKRRGRPRKTTQAIATRPLRGG